MVEVENVLKTEAYLQKTRHMAKKKITFTEEQLRAVSSLYPRAIKVNHEKSTLVRDANMIRRAFGLDGDNSNDPRLVLLNEFVNHITEVAEKSETEARMDENRYYGIDSYDMFNMDIEDAVRLIAGEDLSAVDEGGCLTDKTYELSSFLIDNMQEIEQLVHQKCNDGGILPGVTYVCLDREGIWYTEEEFNKRNDI